MNEQNYANDDWQCPFCGTIVRHGFSVCVGCQAKLIYGLTRSEWESTALGGVLLGAVISLLLLVFLPRMLGFGFGWGLGVYAVLPAGFVTAAIAYGLAHFKDTRRRQKPPRFFPRTP